MTKAHETNINIETKNIKVKANVNKIKEMNNSARN